MTSEWNSPDLRAQVTPGTVLMIGDDCYCFVVREITSEGVISREWHNPRRLWTWSELNTGAADIYDHVDLAAESGPGTFARERGGRLRAIQALSQEEWERIVLEPRVDAASQMDAGLAAEILRLHPTSGGELVLRVRAGEDASDGFSMTMIVDGSEAASRAYQNDALLLAAVSCCFRAAAARQPSPWQEMTFTVTRRAGDLKYEVEFGYA